MLLCIIIILRWARLSAYEPTTRISDHRIPWNFYCDMISLFNGKNRIYLARSAISPKFSDDVVPRSFCQKYDGIWSPDHYPCLVIGLVFQKKKKHLWGLVLSSRRSSINFANIPWSECAWFNLCIFVVTSFLPELRERRFQSCVTRECHGFLHRTHL